MCKSPQALSVKESWGERALHFLHEVRNANLSWLHSAVVLIFLYADLDHDDLRKGEGSRAPKWYPRVSSFLHPAFNFFGIPGAENGPQLVCRFRGSVFGAAGFFPH